MAILVCTANATPADGGALYGAQDSTVSTGIEDTYLKSTFVTDNYGSDANWDTLDGFGEEQRALIKFDISSIPASSTITSAHLQCYQDSSGANTDPLHCYGVLRTWDGGTATWNTTDGSTSWGTAGAVNTTSDIDATSQDSNFNTSAPVWRAFDVTSWCQDVVDGVRTNHGLLLGYPNRDDSSGWSNFVSTEGADASRPELWVEYTAASGVPLAAHHLKQQMSN